MTTKDDHALAWAWVLQHASMISGLTRKLGAGSGLDLDDLHSATLERIVRRWHSYDPDCSQPSTWVWWQVRATRKALVKQRLRQQQQQPLDDAEGVLVALPVAEQRVLLRQLEEQATPDEWAACLARGEGYEGRELGDHLGCAPFSARRRVQRFIDRL